MSEDVEITTKELGKSCDISTEDFLKTTLAQMYENDCSVSTLSATLEAEPNEDSPPQIVFEIRLLSINGLELKKGDD